MTSGTGATEPLGADLTPLTVPLDELRDPPEPAGGWPGAERTFPAWATVGCLALLASPVVVGVPAFVLSVVEPESPWPILAVWSVLVLVVGAGISVAAHQLAASTRERVRRLRALAHRNRWLYAQVVPDPTRVGTIFAGGATHRSTRDQVTISHPRSVTLGLHSYHSGGQYGSTHVWGFASARLDLAAPLPHLKLVARRRRLAAEKLPVTHTTPATVELAGPGAEAFEVHGPIGQRTQVQDLLDRTLFRPDVLELLTERTVDVELVEGHVVLHALEVVTTDPATWRWILGLVEAVADSLEQAGR